MVTAGGDGRVNVQVTWGKLLTGLAVVVVTIVSGYWLLIDKMVDGIRDSVASLSADAGQRFQTAATEDRDIRRVIEDARVAVGSEMQASRVDFGARMDKLGDRIVAANQEVGREIGRLRTDLMTSMDKRDGVAQDRFDRLERKIDDLLGKISYEKPWPDQSEATLQAGIRNPLALKFVDFQQSPVPIYGAAQADPTTLVKTLPVAEIEREAGAILEADRRSGTMLVDFGQGDRGWVLRSDLKPTPALCALAVDDTSAAAAKVGAWAPLAPAATLATGCPQPPGVVPGKSAPIPPATTAPR